MKHKLFKPQTLEEGKHGVVGDCNGIPMEVRYREETPMFARKILLYYKDNCSILDYGCGVGRIAKEILSYDIEGCARIVGVIGVDPSEE